MTKFYMYLLVRMLLNVYIYIFNICSTFQLSLSHCVSLCPICYFLKYGEILNLRMVMFSQIYPDCIPLFPPLSLTAKLASNEKSISDLKKLTIKSKFKSIMVQEYLSGLVILISIVTR